MQTITIADIAKRAGVGTATVDRVLNNRPGVNSETIQKVRNAIAALGSPPVVRGRPRANRDFRLAYVLPDTESPFFEQIERQIALVASDFRHKHTIEVTHRFNAEDPADFAAKLAQVTDCDGIALLAPDLPAIKLAINDKIRAGIHVVTLFSDVAGSMRQVYIGADNRAAGRTAGLLLARMCAPPKNTLLLLAQATRFSAQIERRIGFLQVIEECFPHLQNIHTLELPFDDEAAKAELTRFFTEISPQTIGGVYNIGTANEGISAALQTHGAPPFILHDATDSHQNLLVSGSAAYVLHQDIHYSVLTAARVLRALCENVRGAFNVVQPRIEILTSENLH